jgi:protein tyrosine/serine phosphatase
MAVGRKRGVRSEHTLLDAVLDARPSYLRAAFKALKREFRSFDRYVIDAIGISDNERDQLSRTLLH